ncbi:hypothetical protein HWV62_28092 [Athelia sp. TMB]|nr:hypothetical protein HWV62_28092 [Athelia sp. TMB]
MDVPIAQVLSLVPVPYLHAAFTALRYIYSSVQHAQESKQQLAVLAQQAAYLMHTLDVEYRAGRLKESTSTSATLGRLMSVLNGISRFVQEQASQNFLKALFLKEKRISQIESGRQIQPEEWMITSYEVEFGQEIGSGGFGRVFRGTWNKTDVALKVLKSEGGVTASSESYQIESHKASSEFLGANVLDERPFIVMPYLQNGNVKVYLRAHPGCNRLKIVNVLIDDSEKAVLCDFGLSRVKADASSRLVGDTQNRVVMGSRNWMSPERMLGGSLRKPCDTYAFGMTIFEIFTNEIPLGHIHYADLLELVVKLDVRPERPEGEEIIALGLSDAVWELAERCWDKTPSQRPTADYICDVLFQLMEAIPDGESPGAEDTTDRSSSHNQPSSGGPSSDSPTSLQAIIPALSRAPDGPEQTRSRTAIPAPRPRGPRPGAAGHNATLLGDKSQSEGISITYTRELDQDQDIRANDEDEAWDLSMFTAALTTEADQGATAHSIPNHAETYSAWQELHSDPDHDTKSSVTLIDSAVTTSDMCLGCETPILEQTVDVNQGTDSQFWHSECYIINNQWGVKVKIGRQHSDTFKSGAVLVSSKDIGELNRALALHIKQVSRIRTVFSGFEESCAACTTEIIAMFTNGHYFGILDEAEKFALHLEVLLASIDDIQYRFQHLNTAAMNHVQESRILCQKSMKFFAILTRPKENAIYRKTNLEELLALAPGIQGSIKTAIRIALNGAIKLERQEAIEGIISSVLDDLQLLAEDSTYFSRPRLVKSTGRPSRHERTQINPTTDGVVYGFASLAPENTGE